MLQTRFALGICLFLSTCSALYVKSSDDAEPLFVERDAAPNTSDITPLQARTQYPQAFFYFRTAATSDSWTLDDWWANYWMEDMIGECDQRIDSNYELARPFQRSRFYLLGPPNQPLTGVTATFEASPPALLIDIRSALRWAIQDVTRDRPVNTAGSLRNPAVNPWFRSRVYDFFGWSQIQFTESESSNFHFRIEATGPPSSQPAQPPSLAVSQANGLSRWAGCLAFQKMAGSRLAAGRRLFTAKSISPFLQRSDTRVGLNDTGELQLLPST